jgi:hypothetical protein
MAIYNVSITLPDGELDTITVEAPTAGAAQAEARSLAGLGSRIGRATEADRESFRPTPDIDLRAQIARIDEINKLLDTIIEGDETPRQELIKNETENRLADRMLTFARLREGREERLMAVKAAEAMAKYRAYERNFREANPDLPSELEVLGNELLPDNKEVATAVTNEVNARDLSDLQQSDIASINREAERQKARKLASLVTEDEIDEYNFGETVSNEKARQFTQSQQADADAVVRAAQFQPQFGTTTDELAGLAEDEMRPPVTPRTPGIDEGTDVGFGAGGGFDPSAMTSATTPGGSSFDEFIASLDPMAESESMSNVLGAAGYGLPAFDPTQIDEGTGPIGDLLTGGGGFDPAAQAEIDRLNAENAAMAAMMADMNQTPTDGTIGTGASITADPALDVINDLIGGGDGIVTDGTTGGGIVTDGTAGTTGTGVQMTPQPRIPFGEMTPRSLEGVSRTAAIRSALGNLYGPQFGTGRGPLGSFLESQAFGLTPAFEAAQIANIARGEPRAGTTGTFSDYLRNLGQQSTGLQTGYQQALEDINFLRGQDLGGAAALASPTLFAPRGASETAAAIDLLGAAQRGKYSPFARRIFGNVEQGDVFGDYILEADRRARAGGGPVNFLDFAAGRFGL